MSDQRPGQTEPRSAILRPSERAHANRSGSATTVHLVTPACGATSLLNGITTFAPGAASAKHTHNCEESVIILEGRAIVEIDETRFAVGTGEATWIAADVPHRFVNASATAPLRIFWSFPRADATRTLTETGQTRLITAESPDAQLGPVRT